MHGVAAQRPGEVDVDRARRRVQHLAFADARAAHGERWLHAGGTGGTQHKIAGTGFGQHTHRVGAADKCGMTQAGVAAVGGAVGVTGHHIAIRAHEFYRWVQGVCRLAGTIARCERADLQHVACDHLQQEIGGADIEVHHRGLFRAAHAIQGTQAERRQHRRSRDRGRLVGRLRCEMHHDLRLSGRQRQVVAVVDVFAASGERGRADAPVGTGQHMRDHRIAARGAWVAVVGDQPVVGNRYGCVTAGRGDEAFAAVGPQVGADRHRVVDGGAAGVGDDFQEAGKTLVGRHIDLAADLHAADRCRAHDHLAPAVFQRAGAETGEVDVVHAAVIGVAGAVADIAVALDVPAETGGIEQVDAQAGRHAGAGAGGPARATDGP